MRTIPELRAEIHDILSRPPYGNEPYISPYGGLEEPQADEPAELPEPVIEDTQPVVPVPPEIEQEPAPLLSSAQEELKIEAKIRSIKELRRMNTPIHDIADLCGVAESILTGYILRNGL